MNSAFFFKYIFNSSNFSRKSHDFLFPLLSPIVPVIHDPLLAAEGITGNSRKILIQHRLQFQCPLKRDPLTVDLISVIIKDQPTAERNDRCMIPQHSLNDPHAFR